jgi:phage terminase Nu1 subunit (DNA packaging protein)
MTRPQLAAAFNVSEMTITRWERDGMPVARRFTRGRSTLFSRAGVEKWRDSHQVSDQPDGVKLTIAKARLADAQREKVELDNAERQLQLLPRDQIVREVAALMKGLTAQLRSLPRRAVQTGAINGDQVVGLEELVREILIEISLWKTVADLPKETAS